MRHLFVIILLNFCFAQVIAAEISPSNIKPKRIGFRTVVLEYVVDEDAKPTNVSIVSSEAEELNYWAENLVKNGVVKEGTTGVVSFPGCSIIERIVIGDDVAIVGDAGPDQSSHSRPQSGARQLSTDQNEWSG